ncbi:MAG: hypothetical protein O3B09_04515, partial [Proteobacteria bacterium]|nr:hypothetical protein [Pseudomonadota bacterium]
MPDDAKQPMTPERLDEFCRLLGEYAQDNKKKDIHKFITNSEPFTIKINGKEKTINANHDFSVSTLGGDVGDQYVNGILKFFRENSNSAPDMLFTS